MGINFKLGDAFNAFNGGALNNLQKVPVSAFGLKESMKVQKIIRKTMQHLRDYSSERDKLYKELSVPKDPKKPDGDREIPKENENRWDTAINGALEEEVQIEVNPVVLKETIGEHLTIGDLSLLWFIWDLSEVEEQ